MSYKYSLMLRAKNGWKGLISKKIIASGVVTCSAVGLICFANQKEQTKFKSTWKLPSLNFLILLPAIHADSELRSCKIESVEDAMNSLKTISATKNLPTSEVISSLRELNNFIRSNKKLSDRLLQLKAIDLLTEVLNKAKDNKSDPLFVETITTIGILLKESNMKRNAKAPAAVKEIIRQMLSDALLTNPENVINAFELSELLGLSYGSVFMANIVIKITKIHENDAKVLGTVLERMTRLTANDDTASLHIELFDRNFATIYQKMTHKHVKNSEFMASNLYFLREYLYMNRKNNDYIKYQMFTESVLTDLLSVYDLQNDTQIHELTSEVLNSLCYADTVMYVDLLVKLGVIDRILTSYSLNNTSTSTSYKDTKHEGVLRTVSKVSEEHKQQVKDAIVKHKLQDTNLGRRLL